MTRLIAFGCSYTRGTGLDDVWNFEKNSSIFPTPSKHAWPQLLADELNVECINLGKGGLSNKAIWHDFVNFNFQDNDIIFVHWTFLDRYHFYENKNKGYIIDHKGQHTRDKVFFKHLNDLYLRMNHVNSLQKVHNLLVDPIENVDWNTVTPLDVYLNDYKIKYPRANDNSHPGMLAHKEFSKQLLQNLKY